MSKDKTNEPIVFETWDEAYEYITKHCKPVGKNPRGKPVYDMDDIEALNIKLTDDFKGK